MEDYEVVTDQVIFAAFDPLPRTPLRYQDFPRLQHPPFRQHPLPSHIF